MGRLAIDLACAFKVGTARGETSQLSAHGISRGEFFRSFGDSFDSLVLRKIADFKKSAAEFEAMDLRRLRTSDEPKMRWVDGTPENSFHVFGLRQLFPEARFIHIVRDVDSVVTSLLHFKSVAGFDLIQDELHAYDYWLRAIDFCVRSERTFGTKIVLRLRFRDLIGEPDKTLRTCLEFLDEPYSAACLDPLQKKINSSKVPVDLPPQPNPDNVALIAKARRVSADLLAGLPASNSDEQATGQSLDTDFAERVEFYAQLEAERDGVIEKLLRIRGEKEDLAAALRAADEELTRLRALFERSFPP